MQSTDGEIMKKWMEIIVPMRLPEEIPTDRTPELTPVYVTEDCWLGVYEYTLTNSIRINDVYIAPYNSFEGDKSKASWLPNQDFARLWMQKMGFDPGDIVMVNDWASMHVGHERYVTTEIPGLFTVTGRMVKGGDDAVKGMRSTGIYVMRTSDQKPESKFVFPAR
jgi:hypothetical protein